MMGPWDEMDEDKPFFGSAARPVGAGFYPADLTKEQFDDYLAKHPGEAEALTRPLYGGQAAGRQAGRGPLQPRI